MRYRYDLALLGLDRVRILSLSRERLLAAPAACVTPRPGDSRLAVDGRRRSGVAQRAVARARLDAPRLHRHGVLSDGPAVRRAVRGARVVAARVGPPAVRRSGHAVRAATGRSALADHYWTMVLAADLGAFAPLSVFQTRPPWILEPAPDLPARSVHRMASFMVRHATIGVNTFPSGHVAVSLAVAFAVIDAMPLVGTLLLVVAGSIAIACVVGRYHYAMDVVAGALLAVLVWVVS